MISFVYFDLGGVIIKDFSGTTKWSELLRNLGITDKNQSAFDLLWQRFRDEICTTRDIDSLLPIFNKELGLHFRNGYSLLEDIVDRFERNTSIWPVVGKIASTHPVGMLTNQYPWMLQAIQKRNLLPAISWTAVIDSSIVGVQKPDPKIFRLAEKKAGVHGSEILFVDNTQEHISAAGKLGWQTFYYETTEPSLSSRRLKSFFAKNHR